MYTMTEQLFGDWMQEQMDRFNWSQADLSRESHLSTGMIAMLRNNQRLPGKNSCQKLAKAFGQPVDRVYRLAGILPPVVDENPVVEESIYLLKLLEDSHQEQVRAIIRMFHQQEIDERKRNPRHITKPGSS